MPILYSYISDRASKVSYKSIFRNCRRGIINLKTIVDVYADFRAFDHSVSSFPSFTQKLDLSQLCHFSIFFSFRMIVIRIPSQNNATCQCGFTLKRYRCLCTHAFEGEFCEKGFFSVHV